MARTTGSDAVVTRERVLTEAADLFYERGFAGTSMRDISERTDLTKSALYYHFASKDALLDALLEPLFTALDDVTERLSSATEVSPELVSDLVDVFDHDARVIKSAVADPSTARSVMARHNLPSRMAALEKALTKSDEPQAAVRARCALGAIHGATSHAPGAQCAKRAPKTRIAQSSLGDDDKELVVGIVMRILNQPKK